MAAYIYTHKSFLYNSLSELQKEHEMCCPKTTDIKRNHLT